MPEILRQKLFTASFIMLTVTALGTVGYYGLATLADHHPHWSLFECLYMTMITLTTVGFGEVIDVGNVAGARQFTILILLSGLGVAAYFVSTLTAFLVEGELKNVFWRKKMDKQISKLNDHIIVCGGGRVGFYIVQELIRTKKEFVLIDRDEQRIRQLQDEVGSFAAVIGDATFDHVLEEAGVTKAHGLISALNDDKDNLCVLVTCRQLNRELRVISGCRTRDFAGKLEMLGAEVVIPNFIGGLRMASQMIRPRVVGYLDTMLRDRDHLVRIEDVTLTKGSDLIGRTIGDLDFRAFGNLLLLAVLAPGSEYPIYNPLKSQILGVGDTLVFQAELSAIREFEQRHA